MVDASLERLQAASQARHHLDLNGGLRQATGLALDANGISQFLFRSDINQNFDGLMTLLEGGLLLDGSTNGYIETSDKAALDIPGDIDVRVEYTVTGSILTAESLLAKWTPAAQQSYRLVLIPALALNQFITSSTGANAVTNQNTDAANGRRQLAIRVTLDADNGAAGRTARFYTAATLDGPWVESAGSPVVNAGTTTVFNSTAVLRLGATGAGAEGFGGIIHRAELRNGIDGTVVANPDLRNVTPGATSFADAAGNTWNLGSAARVA